MKLPDAWTSQTPTSHGTRARKLCKELMPMIAVMIIVMAARSSLADHYVIPSGSMEDTLAVGDHVFVDKLAYGVRIPFTDIERAPGDVPRRGEVIIFDSPEDGKRLIKRVVATGGDQVSMVSGRLRVNGRLMRDSIEEDVDRFGERLALLNMAYGGGPDIAPSRVPIGQLLVVGDSRGNSRDGRFFGWVPEELAYGKAISVIYRKGEGLVWKDL